MRNAYIIRQKSTGHTLPVTGRGSTHGVFGHSVARLFNKRHHAQCTLDHWLKGVIQVTQHCSWDCFGEPDEDIHSTIIPQPDRDPADYEVVEIEMRRVL